MRRNPIGLLISLALLVSLVAHLSGAKGQTQGPSRGRGTPVAPSLAKARLLEATAAAKKWKADATLLQVVGHGIGADGMLVSWDYGFYSGAAKTCLVVNVVPNVAPHIVESGGPECAGPELKEFMDSGQAIKIARSNGITAATASMAASVSRTKQGERAVWTVMDGRGMKSEDVMLDIDALSGAVLSKTVQR